VPWRTQLWAGAVEVGLIWLAAVQSSGRGPTLQEAAPLLVYSLLLYFAPLAAVYWQEHKEHEKANLKASSSTAQALRSSKGDLASASTASTDGDGSSRPDGAIKARAVPVTSSQQDSTRQQQGPGEHQHAPEQHTAQRTGRQQTAPLMISVAGLARAAQARGPALYTSPVQHNTMSVKVRDTYMLVRLDLHPPWSTTGVQYCLREPQGFGCHSYRTSMRADHSRWLPLATLWAGAPGAPHFSVH
jgi:hypothetical protein